MWSILCWSFFSSLIEGRSNNSFLHAAVAAAVLCTCLPTDFSTQIEAPERNAFLDHKLHPCTDPLIHTTIFEEKALSTFQRYWRLVRPCCPVLILDLKWDLKIWSLAITGCHIWFEDFGAFRQERPKEPSEQVPRLGCCKYWPHSLPTFWYNVGTLTRIHSMYFWQCSSCTNVSSRYWYVGEN
jgi:hypothetical protein